MPGLPGKPMMVFTAGKWRDLNTNLIHEVVGVWLGSPGYATICYRRVCYGVIPPTYVNTSVTCLRCLALRDVHDASF